MIHTASITKFNIISSAAIKLVVVELVIIARTGVEPNSSSVVNENILPVNAIISINHVHTSIRVVNKSVSSIVVIVIVVIPDTCVIMRKVILTNIPVV